MCDLWIRSQSRRRLIKLNTVFADGNQIWCDNRCWLGDYETEERALEVLDEIQKLLMGDFIKFVNIDVDKDIVDYLNAKAILINDPDCKQKVSFEHRDCIVFEMPEK